MQFQFMFHEFSRSLSPMAKQYMNRATPAFLRSMACCTTPAQVWDAAKRAVRSVFPLASPPELDLITVFFINKTFRKAFVTVWSTVWGDCRDDQLDKKSEVSEMNKIDMLLMQQAMDKMHRFETEMSNIMKKACENAQAAIQALKGS